jgi:type II secretion system protein H
MRRRLHKRGFTLIELLVVLVIFGVMAVLISTSVVGSSEVANVRSAARGFVQLSRYARTMAVLHQKPMEFSFTANGQIRVTPYGAASSAQSLVSAKAFATTNTLADQEAAAEAELEAEEDQGGIGYSMADIATTQKYDQIKITFVEYLDVIDDGWHARIRVAFAKEESSDSDEEEEEEVSQTQILYRSNGTCRPYRVQVSGDGDEGETYTLNITVDRLGVATIDEDEEESA